MCGVSFGNLASCPNMAVLALVIWDTGGRPVQVTSVYVDEVVQSDSKDDKPNHMSQALNKNSPDRGLRSSPHLDPDLG